MISPRNVPRVGITEFKPITHECKIGYVNYIQFSGDIFGTHYRITHLVTQFFNFISAQHNIAREKEKDDNWKLKMSVLSSPVQTLLYVKPEFSSGMRYCVRFDLGRVGDRG